MLENSLKIGVTHQSSEFSHDQDLKPTFGRGPPKDRMTKTYRRAATSALCQIGNQAQRGMAFHKGCYSLTSVANSRVKGLLSTRSDHPLIQVTRLADLRKCFEQSFCSLSSSPHKHLTWRLRRSPVWESYCGFRQRARRERCRYAGRDDAVGY